MNGCWRALLSIAVSLSLAACASRAPVAVSPPKTAGAWAALRQLPEFSTIRVERLSGRTTGRLLEVDDARIMLRVRDTITGIPRHEVARVVLRERHIGRKARWGLGIGAGRGIMVTAITTDSNQAAIMAILAGGWGMIGAGIGAIAGATEVRETVVFRGPPRSHALVAADRSGRPHRAG